MFDLLPATGRTTIPIHANLIVTCACARTGQVTMRLMGCSLADPASFSRAVLVGRMLLLALYVAARGEAVNLPAHFDRDWGFDTVLTRIRETGINVTTHTVLLDPREYSNATVELQLGLCCLLELPREEAELFWYAELGRLCTATSEGILLCTILFTLIELEYGTARARAATLVGDKLGGLRSLRAQVLSTQRGQVKNLWFDFRRSNWYGYPAHPTKSLRSSQ